MKSTIVFLLIVAVVAPFVVVSSANELVVSPQSRQISNENKKKEINILLLLPTNESYKFSLNKVLASLNLAIQDLKTTDYGAKFQVAIVSDSCDCSGIKAPINAMENIFGRKNHTKKFQAVFGPMCD
jgi:membrane glycosyltransferase